MVRKSYLAAAAAAAAVATFGAPAASAAAPITCASYSVTIVNDWSSCAGFYDGNIFSSTAGNVAKQVEGVTALGGTFDGDFDSLFGFGSLGDGSNGLRTIQFGQTFYGETIIGMHFGNIGGPRDQYGDVSVFYKFDFGQQGASSLTLQESRGLSNLYVYNNGGVPEPAAWALMILGFGAVGGALRRRTATLRRFAIA